MKYRDIARRYDTFNQHAVTLWHLGYHSVIDHLGQVSNCSILDYGCGTGIFSRFLCEKGATVTGVDVSDSMITVAKNKGPAGISYHHITSGNLKFIADSAFDHAIANFVLCTISTRQEMRKILDEIYRVLKKDGLFIVLNSNWDKSNGREFISFKLEYCDALVSGQNISVVIKSSPPIILNDYYWSQDDYRDFLKQSGFIVHHLDEPLAAGDDLPWMDEKRYPPYVIITAEK
jgi:ubiquinone/menaquinone biosynthesis C-methylase UbiE